ncbi:L-idonate 5-dehydrogenase [Aliiroseovarius crassostreae]|uniref:L-idonate 5-dehydrogenase n=1 Tax=Aliiroseovarius crassostreae TaxID=154981 RepID=UPI003C7D662F
MGRHQVLVRISNGGICGSDLHYFFDGGVGPIRVTEPLVLGHEIAGIVAEIGDPDCGLRVGDKVSVSPSQPCLNCHFCGRKEYQHCTDMRFLGSAKTTPHVQGGFRQSLIMGAAQCVKISDATPLSHAACAEPLAVCLHAASQAGDLKGKRVLVTGAGPIGALCVAVAKLRGAQEIVATDIADFPLEIAKRVGATQTFNVAEAAEELADYKRPGAQFDVVFECSAAAPAIATAIDVVRPRGTVVQVGVAGSLELPINAIVGKEINFKGTHRFHQEFTEAVQLIDQRKINVEPLLTHIFPLSEAEAAFEQAVDRSDSMKVQLSFDG